LVQGTVLQYAAIHNFGGVVNIPEQIRASGQKPFAWKNGEGRMVFSRRIRARKVTIPKRQFIGLSDRDRLRIEQIAADNLARGTP
jgi:phage gpG-like protein